MKVATSHMIMVKTKMHNRIGKLFMVFLPIIPPAIIINPSIETWFSLSSVGKSSRGALVEFAALLAFINISRLGDK